MGRQAASTGSTASSTWSLEKTWAAISEPSRIEDQASSFVKFLPLQTAETSARVSPEARAVFASVLWKDSLALRAAPKQQALECEGVDAVWTPECVFRSSTTIVSFLISLCERRHAHSGSY